MELKVHQGDTALLIVDIQERLAPAMDPTLYGALLDNFLRLGRVCELLDIPVVISEQYPQGLGFTVTPLREVFLKAAVLPKTSFSVCGDDMLKEALKATGKKTILVGGMETHVCVYQSVRDLAKDRWVHVLADACASRTRANYELGLRLCERSGAVITSTETAIFDLLERAGSDIFKQVSKLIK